MWGPGARWSSGLETGGKTTTLVWKVSFHKREEEGKHCTVAKKFTIRKMYSDTAAVVLFYYYNDLYFQINVTILLLHIFHLNIMFYCLQLKRSCIVLSVMDC